MLKNTYFTELAFLQTILLSKNLLALVYCYYLFTDFYQRETSLCESMKLSEGDVYQVFLKSTKCVYTFS